MHALVVTLGTDGDVFPYIGLCQRLHQRGHRVTLISGERYRAWSDKLGFELVPMHSEAELLTTLADPDLWHPWRYVKVAVQWGTQRLKHDYDLLARLLEEHRQQVVLVANPGIIGARILHEQTGIPLVSLILQPWVIPSVAQPPVMPWTLPDWSPVMARRLYWCAWHGLADLLIGRPVNQLRGSLGLPPVKRILDWWLSPQRVLALFPDWFGPPQADWPSQIRVLGFPLYDGGFRDNIPPAVTEFLEAGPPPVAVTFGTGMLHAASLFAAVVQACEQFPMRCLLLTRHPEQLPSPLPDQVWACEYAPFRWLFPRCAAVVHHGGVGTTSQALAAGVPQVVLPFAFDQPDNARRIHRLGAGTWMPARQVTPARLVAALQQVTKPPVRARCQELAQHLAGRDALSRAAEEIEALVR